MGYVDTLIFYGKYYVICKIEFSILTDILKNKNPKNTYTEDVLIICQTLWGVMVQW